MNPLTNNQRLSLVFAFFGFRLIDIATTWIGITFGVVELNPLVVRFGPMILLPMNLFGLIGLVFATEQFNHDHWRKIRMPFDLFLVGFTTLVALGALWNVFVLL